MEEEYDEDDDDYDNGDEEEVEEGKEGGGEKLWMRTGSNKGRTGDE